MGFVCTHLADVARDTTSPFPSGPNSANLDSISTGDLTIPKNALMIVSIGLGEGAFFFNETWIYAIGGLGLVWTDYLNGPGFLHNDTLSQNRKIAVFTALSNPTVPLVGRVSVTSLINLPIFSWSMSVDMITWDDPKAGIIPITRQVATYTTDRGPNSSTVDLALSSNLADTDSALFGVAYTDTAATPSVTTAGFQTMGNLSHTDVNSGTNLLTAFRPAANAVTDKHFAVSEGAPIGWAMANIELAQTATDADVCDDPVSIIVSGSSEEDLYTGRLFASTFDKFRVLVQNNSPIAAFNYNSGQNGAVQVFTVPASVHELTCELWGGGGAGNAHSGPGGRGLGGYVKATIDVTPGEQLVLMVGGVGNGGLGGNNGGGTTAFWTSGGYAGGGATDIRRPPGTMADRLLVAGGGGGSGGNSAAGYPAGRGGDGGYPSGQDGMWNDFVGGMWVDTPSVGAGKGGTQMAGGAGGDHVGFGGVVGHAGIIGVGGNCGGSGVNLGVAAGGGGGGLYGGGGACASPASFTPGGGGGSSGCPDPTARNIVYQNGVNDDYGKVVLWGNFENFTFHRSEDKGRTWEAISAPDQSNDNDNQHGNYVTAVDDDGTIHAARIISGAILYWRYVGTSWVGPVVVDTTGDAVNNFPVYLGSDGSTLVLIMGSTAGVGRTYAYKSVDSGATWTVDGSSHTGDPVPFLAGGFTVHVAWIGSYIHLVYQASSVPYARYRRLDPATMTFEMPITAPTLSVGAGSNAGLQPRIFSANGATTHLYIVQIATNDTFNIFSSNDAGLHWSTVVNGETFPFDWRVNNFTFANGGVNMGSDNRLHFYGQATDDATKVLRTISRSLSPTTPDWKNALVVGIPPNDGQRRATTPNDHSQMFPITRRDGFHSRKYDVIGIFYLGSSLVPPTEVLQIRCVGRQGFLINQIGFGTG